MPLTPQQLALIADASLLQAKADATATLTTHLHALSDTLRAEIAQRQGQWRLPTGFNPSAFQVARGENLDNLPYQYLDCPRFYSKTDIFAFRVLIWWGRAVHHCWIFKGAPLVAIREQLLAQRGVLDADLCIWTGTELWDWSQPRPVSELDAGALRRLDFLKIGLSRPLTATHLSADGLKTDALATWAALGLLRQGG